MKLFNMQYTFIYIHVYIYICFCLCLSMVYIGPGHYEPGNYNCSQRGFYMGARLNEPKINKTPGPGHYAHAVCFVHRDREKDLQTVVWDEN